MKRATALALAAAAASMALALSACASIGEGAGGAFDEHYTPDFPAEYSITYSVQDPEGDTTEVSKTQDPQGNIRYVSGNTDALFIASGKGEWERYEHNKEGAYVPTGGELYGEDQINTITKDFDTYAKTSSQKNMPGTKQEGSVTVLGRAAALFSNRVGTSTTGVTYTLTVDDETGLCIGWIESKKVDGTTQQPDAAVFHATKFLTSNIGSLASLIS
ncbi:hypothetical protein [Bifidobacterium psychraerophilum]|uniref:Lipoprotein n=1 Tax=Bifidobacterium psychraerophilum TaxID=218140 RepID=A0A087CJ61_9BIFI|nr:hypothetical protein [Bifidobacterium psychraerophilum]KFI83311.1 hypothetical protein BPSY_0406 [Bifidobacterium psychraerophilum]PKA94364.1 hypothetical protein A9A89_0572 [Bifidobacterium psychraerophilum DSM 22366]